MGTFYFPYLQETGGRGFTIQFTSGCTCNSNGVESAQANFKTLTHSNVRALFIAFCGVSLLKFACDGAPLSWSKLYFVGQKTSGLWVAAPQLAALQVWKKYGKGMEF